MATIVGYAEAERRQRIREQALELLTANRRPAGKVPGRLSFSCPSPGHYPFQWFWDSCFHAVALAHLRPEWASSEIDALLSAQQADGLIPHVVFWDRRFLWNHRLYWCWLQSRGWGLPRTSALIQPPVLALAIERYVAITGDRAPLRRWLPALDRYHQWLLRERMSQNGLLTILAPWESGMDHKPSYDAALGLRYPAPARQVILEPRMVDLANRAAGYRQGRMMRRGRFRVEDVLVNAVHCAALRALSRLHRLSRGDVAATSGVDAPPDTARGSYAGPTDRDHLHPRGTNAAASTSQPSVEEPAAVWEALADRSEQAMVASLRGEDGFFYDRDARTDRLLPVRTVGGLAALLLVHLDPASSAVLAGSISDPAGFAATYRLPSVALAEPAFVAGAQRYGAGPLIWRGPAWINLNWLLAPALLRHGYPEIAASLRCSAIALAEQSGFREYYHPFSGEGLGARSFGWSTLVVDMFDE